MADFKVKLMPPKRHQCSLCLEIIYNIRTVCINGVICFIRHTPGATVIFTVELCRDKHSSMPQQAPFAVSVAMRTRKSISKVKKVTTSQNPPDCHFYFIWFRHIIQGRPVNCESLYVCVCIYREMRSLVIEMVLATDMSSHLFQVKAMKSCLQQQER